ncbi:uncharacterized protein SCHCODRAFT_02617713 [Schizophyllum commune H4-8]|uniref:uncharacterized protein n=1 Tax=Schizophyllum commune (strain H4-8 / FGSC 9210) TaxID=578458 RepID=UPI002160F811|nr:uncharacterized protein SCHCODRAFT_02617713 [Schizophyllum commune H4-8]KAI5894752.1 hypothetical protein SCHCODRAFT_02617713 [Schizophyllum commune H4-8]
MYLFIVLYAYKVENQRIQGLYHWALLPHATEDLDARSLIPATVYQITNEGDGNWKTDHRRVNVLNTDRMIGFVRLPEVKTITEETMSQFISELPATHDRKSYPRDAQHWSCAWWAIRVIRSFIDAGIMDNPFPFRISGDEWFEKFKQRVQARGMTLEGRSFQVMARLDSGGRDMSSVIVDL